MTAFDLINSSPSSPLNGGVPNRFLTGKYVNYNHWKVIGYRQFVHVPNDERSKLDSKSKLLHVRTLLEDHLQPIMQLTIGVFAKADSNHPHVSPKGPASRKARWIHPMREIYSVGAT